MRTLQAALILSIGVCLASAGTAAPAGNPVDVLTFASEAEEQRFRSLVGEFRCPKCLNTNLLGSDAPIAKDLRKAVYRLSVEQGQSDDEVRAYLQERYGDFVLYSPPLRPANVLLWFGPPGLLLLGAFWWFRTVRRAATGDATDFDAEARVRLDNLLDGDA
ncbi:MAG: cytochrome c-type biogenesis protein [Pseudomonadota bacterium]